MKFSHFTSHLKDIDDANYTVRAVFSTADVDRHGEVVDQKSWILDSYLKNPVILFGHDHNQPPIGKVTGLGYNENGDLEGTMQFAAKEYPFANVIYQLYKGGFMRAFSVGFASKTVDVVDGQVILKDNELYEISTVSVPANAMALAKSKGLNVEPLETKLVSDLAKKFAELDVKACEEHNEKNCVNCPPDKNVEDTVVDLDEEAAKETAETTVEEEAKDVVEDETGEKPGDTIDEDTAEVEVQETETKGALADELADVDERQAKYEALEEVYNIIDAFFNVVWSEDTKVEDLPAIISEMGDLLKKQSGDTESGKTLAEAMATVSTEAKTKAAETLLARIKEGRVLSKANRGAVEAAIEALQKVLDADKPKEEDKSEETPDDTEVLRANIAEKSRDIVATPAARVAASKGASKSRAINKAVRSLLAEKRKLKK